MLAALVVHLKANYGNLTSGLKVAQNTVASTVASIRRNIGGVTQSFVGLLTAGGVIAGVTYQMQALDRVTDVGNRTGFGAAAISGLGFAAQLSGSDIETLQASLEKFSAGMGQAAFNSGPAISGLQRLGLSFESLRNLSPDEQLLKIADAMKALHPEAARNAVAMQLFGKSGAALAPMLSQGSAGLQEFIDRSKRLGFGFSQEELNRVAAANDAIDTLKATTGAAFGAIAVAIAPMMTSISTGLQDWIDGFGGVTSGVNTLRDAWVTTQNYIATGIVYAMAIGEFAMNSWQQIGMLAINSVMLGFVRFGATLEHFFMATLPTWFEWFGKNWRDVFMTAFDFASTVFINLSTNIGRTMSRIWDFIASGGQGTLEVAWEPLTEGFVNSIKSLPDVPKQIIGPLEEQLASEVASLSDTLGNDLGTMLNDRLDALQSIQNQVPSSAGAGPAGLPQAADSGGTSSSGGESKGAGGALKKGSAEAFSAIFAAMRGSQNGKEAQALKAQQAAAKAAAQTAVNTDKIATALQGGATIAVVESL